jgi:hypothetical protein
MCCSAQRRLNRSKSRKKNEANKDVNRVFHGNFKSSAQINNFALKAKKKENEKKKQRGKAFRERLRKASNEK